MILVTVGLHTQPFDRLVRAADELASLVDEPVIIQYGMASFVPRSAQGVDYVDESQMQKWVAECRVVVSHAGAGSILGALQAGKPLVLAPRMARLSEALDDHQFELAEALSERGRAVMVKDLSAETLAEAIAQAAERNKGETGGLDLRAALHDWLAAQAAQPLPRRRWPWSRKRRGG